MGFFKRLFSADYRAAVAAEAAGDLELAAERYALAGYHDAAARMHMARAERASNHAQEIEALRDALHWAPEDGELHAPACKALGDALLARARAEGIATERDRERVREAARLLEAAGEWAEAGQAWESIGDEQEAARSYGEGGLVDRLETVLARTDEASERTRKLRDAFADYEVHLQNGDRDAARAALAICLETAEQTGEYRRLLDELDSKLITGGHATLRGRRDAPVIVAARSPILIGRDALCDLVLRSGGISRRHTEIAVVPPSDQGHRFVLRDAGSRNGTLIGGLPVAGAVPLTGEGTFAMGEVYELSYRVTESDAPLLVLEVTRGLDQGTLLVVCEEDQWVGLAAIAELPVAIRFRDGRPFTRPDPDGEKLSLNGRTAAVGLTQLIHGDLLTAGSLEIEVE